MTSLSSWFIGGGRSHHHLQPNQGDSSFSLSSSASRREQRHPQPQPQQEQPYENATLVDESNNDTIDNAEVPRRQSDGMNIVVWESPMRGRIRRRQQREPHTGTEQQQQQQQQHHHSVSDFKVQIPSALCDICVLFWDWAQAAVEVWIELLSAPPLPLGTLQKLSIVFLGMEKIRDNLDHTAAVMLMFMPRPATAGAAVASGGEGNEPWILYAMPQYFLWGIPAVVALFSVSFVITFQLTWNHQEEAVIATALMSLIFLEALLPLFILGCASMFLFQQVSWESGLALLVLVWLGSTFSAHCIRRMLYQSLGHG